MRTQSSEGQTHHPQAKRAPLPPKALSGSHLLVTSPKGRGGNNVVPNHTMRAHPATLVVPTEHAEPCAEQLHILGILPLRASAMYIRYAIASNRRGCVRESKNKRGADREIFKRDASLRALPLKCVSGRLGGLSLCITKIVLRRKQ